MYIPDLKGASKTKYTREKNLNLLKGGTPSSTRVMTW